jgi:hypothetical protein
MAKNVDEYFAETFNKPPTHDESDLKEYSLDSHCGIECKKIIDAAAKLAAMCDSHSDVVNPLLQAVTAAIEIVCFG